jgi:hypothetical protein
MASKAQRVGRTLRSRSPAPAARAAAKSASVHIDVPAYQGFWPDQPAPAARPGVARASPRVAMEPVAEKFSLVTACRACRDAPREGVQRHDRHFRYSSHLGPTHAMKSCHTACLPSMPRSGLIRGFTPQGRPRRSRLTGAVPVTALVGLQTDRAAQVARCCLRALVGTRAERRAVRDGVLWSHSGG